MVLVSTIILDKASQSATLNIEFSGMTVENITYQNSELTFHSRPSVSISFVDFRDLVEQFKIFELAIQKNFLSQNLPFESLEVSEKESGFNSYNFLLKTISPPNALVNYRTDLSSQQTSLQNRPLDGLCTYAQWLYFLITLQHYESSLKQRIG